MRENNFSEDIFTELYTPYKNKKILRDTKKLPVKGRTFTDGHNQNLSRQAKLAKVLTPISCGVAVLAMVFFGANVLNANHGSINVSAEAATESSENVTSEIYDSNTDDENDEQEENDSDIAEEKTTEPKIVSKKPTSSNRSSNGYIPYSYKNRVDQNVQKMPNSNSYPIKPNTQNNDNKAQKNTKNDEIILAW